MFSMVLSVVVMSTSGGLLAERVPTTGLLLGAVDLNAASASYDNMTVAELTAERVKLVEALPSLGLGIGLTAAGGGVLLTGLIVLAYSYEVAVAVVGLVIMALSVPLLIIGPIFLFAALRERREAQTQIRLVDQRIAQVRRDEMAPPVRTNPPPPPSGGDEVPPPPPTRPPGSEREQLEPQLLLATF